jgi:hypothetical protein
MTDPEPEQTATIDPPRAIRVRTSTGWADLAIQGPPGAVGATGPQGPAGPTGGQGPPGQGVPAGGATGTILTKKSTTDYDSAWSPAPVALPPGGATGQSLTKKSAADGDAQWVTLDNLHYLGAYAAGSYVEGDVVVYQGVAYAAIRPTSAAPAQWPMPPSSRPSYGTTLPANPYDGQEAILVDSVTAPTYQWRFRYNASSSSAYKWEFVGGAPAQSWVAAQDTCSGAGGTWQNLATPGPMFTLPRGGDYWIDGFVQVQAGASIPDTPAFGFSDNGDQNPGVAYQTELNRASSWITMAVVDLKQSRNVGDVIKARYLSYQTTSKFSGRRLRVTPVRVS